MSEEENSKLTDLIELGGSIPDPVQTSFFKAVGQLLGGLTAFPAAWLKRPAQAVDDVTQARSQVAALMAQGVAKGALEDPEVMRAATEIYLPTNIRKARNKVKVAMVAAERLSEQDTSGADGAPPDDDWMNTFTRFAEDASSERLQDLFARILAGEVRKSGSFSLSTLRAVTELDQSIAGDFAETWAKSAGLTLNHTADFDLGSWYSRWQRLAEFGLLHPSGSKSFCPEGANFLNGYGVWLIAESASHHLYAHYEKDCKVTWSHIPFTRVGRELGSILAAPDYAENMRNVAAGLDKSGLAAVFLQGPEKEVEVLHRQSDHAVPKSNWRLF